jgi:hypothetical protein
MKNTISPVYTDILEKTGEEWCAVTTALYPMTKLEGEEEEYLGSLTMLCKLGDITIAWHERNREKVLALIRKKMADGYTFFIMKKMSLGSASFSRRVKLTEKNIESAKEIIIKDEQFEKICTDMDDIDIATLARDKVVDVRKHKEKRSFESSRTAKTAEEVVDNHSLGVRRIHGG